MSRPDYVGEQWMRDNKYQWMNDNQYDCFKMLCDIFGGSHHISDTVYKASDTGIYIDVSNTHFSTFDFNTLTYAVLLAHDRCIRFEISPHSNRKLRLFFFKRFLREGKISQYHPTIEQALETYNNGR